MIQPLEFFPYVAQELYAEKTSVIKCAEKYGTPLFIYSETAIKKAYQALDKSLEGIPHQICYAMKANSNLSILKLIKSMGGGVDTVSGGELFRAKKAGIKPDRIVFSGVGKSVKEIEQALKYSQKASVALINVESLEELDAIAIVAKRLKKTASIGFRFNPDVDALTHKHISTGKNENKFGMTKPEILQALEKYKKHPKIKISGISIHIGSQLTNVYPLRNAFQECAELFELLSDSLPQSLKFIDLGGGVGVQYQNETTIPIDSYAGIIKEIFKRPKFQQYKPKLLLEPGRLIIANSGILVSKILYRKYREDKNFVIVDAGMTELIRPALYEAHHGVLSVKKHLGPTQPIDLVGPICETGDFLARGANLPTGIAQGEYVAVLSAGAYASAMSSQYNSRPRAAEILVSGTKIKVIRKRETERSLILNEEIK
ncbi:MAG: diaminopimelate decarboxylase [Xanthomonadaceae bacterium]|nr:diaminopimelate decarboxylase [Xanthomonadaceae bacterium]